MKLDYIECPTNQIELDDLSGMVSAGNYLFINQQFLLTVWDMTNPCELKKVNEYEFPDSRPGIQLFGGDLYIYGESFREDDSQIHILDISNPLNIKEKQCITLPSEILAVTAMNGNVFAGTRVGIYDCNNSKLIFDCKTSYDCDIISRDEWLVFSGPHEGVRIFRLLNDGSLKLVKHITTSFYMPYGLSWDEPGKSFIVAGADESVLKFDMSAPEKTKRVKGAKTGAELCAQYVRENDMLWVFGLKVQGTTPYMLEVDISDKLPEVKAKHKIEGYLPKSTGSDSALGIIRAGEYLLLATYYCMLGVVKIS